MSHLPRHCIRFSNLLCIERFAFFHRATELGIHRVLHHHRCWLDVIVDWTFDNRWLHRQSWMAFLAHDGAKTTAIAKGNARMKIYCGRKANLKKKQHRRWNKKKYGKQATCFENCSHHRNQMYEIEKIIIMKNTSWHTWSWPPPDGGK